MDRLAFSGVMEMANEMYRIPISISKRISRLYSNHLNILAVVGAGFIMWNVFDHLRFWYTMIQQYVMPSLLSRTKHLRQYGEWAVVTGATGGIGKAYAEELASHGVNVILISRNPEKLKNVSEAITGTYGVKTHLIVADFSLGHKVYAHIKEALKDVDVGILVNNVGVLNDYPQFTTEVPEDKLWEMININIAAAVMMVHIVLPGMVERKRGAIVNVSSAVCCKPTPLVNVYASSKSFIDFFSQALHYEYASKGIFIQSLVAYFVKTNLIPYSTCIRFLMLDPKKYARQAVRTIGISRRTAGHLLHSIQFSITCCLPNWLWVSAINFLSNMIRHEQNLQPVKL
ncbi:inactive hydroxysteroid dehydrogenase-like protein 1 [Pyxicephalus adspersus]|uniref:inactive hydroxysteroid dehydrogenase-like protein 1 n=1 Tax=Pyxicephalus adspersus TaxID=30357 RepID=UPI003B58ECD1